MFGELIIPIVLSMASPEAADFVPAAAEEISQYICEDDLLAGGEKTTEPAAVQPSEEAPMYEMNMPVQKNGNQEKSMPRRGNGNQEKSMPRRGNGSQENGTPRRGNNMDENRLPPQPEPTPTQKRCSRCGKGHLR